MSENEGGKDIDPGQTPSWEDSAAEAGWLSPEEQNNVVKNRLRREREKFAAERSELMERLEALEAEKASSSDDDGDDDVRGRLTALEKQLEASKQQVAERDGLIDGLRKDIVERDILKAAANPGEGIRFLDPNDAVVHLRDRATPDGKILESPGGDVAYNEKTGEPLTTAEAVMRLAKDKPHLVADKTRAGTGHEGPGGDSGEKDIDAQIAEAEKAGNAAESIRLKRLKREQEKQ